MFGRRNNGSHAVTSGGRAKRAWQLELADGDGSGSEADLAQEHADTGTLRVSKDSQTNDGKRRVRRRKQCSPSQNSLDPKDANGDYRETHDDRRKRYDRGNSPCKRSAKEVDGSHDRRRAHQEDTKQLRRRNHRSASQDSKAGRHRRSSDVLPHKENDRKRGHRSHSRQALNGRGGSQEKRRDAHGRRSNRSPSRYNPCDDRGKLRNDRDHVQRHRRRSESMRSRNGADGCHSRETSPLQRQRRPEHSPSQVGNAPREKKIKQRSDDRFDDEKQDSRKQPKNDEASSPKKHHSGNSAASNSPGRNGEEKGNKSNEKTMSLSQDDAKEKKSENNTDRPSPRRSCSPKACDNEEQPKKSGSPPRTASPPAKGDGNDDQKKKKKEYAWMESDDEAEASSEAPPASPSPSHPIAKEVETLGQMLRLAEHLLGQSKQDLQELHPLELVEICAAAARVKYYDPALFQDALAPALLSRFRRGLDATLMADSNHLTVENALDLVASLAALNAASAPPMVDVFRAAARALEEHGTALTIPQRRLLKDVYKTSGREKDVAFIDKLASPTDPGAIAAAAFKGSQRSGVNGDGLQMRPGARICESYAKTGTCRTGATCRNDHPESLRVTYNSDGYPIRPWAPNCPYYMNQGTCDFRKTCKWHHPDKKERGGPGNVSYTSKGAWSSRSMG